MSNALGLDACSFKLRLSSVRSEAERNHYSKEWPCSPGVWMVRVGALRHVRLGALGFVEQLEALDDDKRLL